MNGFLDPPVISRAQVVAENGLGAGDNTDQGHEEYLAYTGEKGHGSNVQIAVSASVADQEPVEDNDHNTLIDTEGKG